MARDRAYWILWYELAEGGRAAYLKWMHGVYLRKVLARRLGEHVNIMVEESHAYGPAANAHDPAGTQPAPCIGKTVLAGWPQAMPVPDAMAG